MRILPYGSSAMLVELPTVAEVHGLVEALGDRLDGVELVPGARTVLIRYDPDAVAADHVRTTVQSAAIRPAPNTSATGPVEIPVIYDGEDLDDVADLLGTTPADVVARHTAPTYTVAFCGFAPGFGYLVGGDPALHVPRLPSPRTRVPAGSVAIAGEYAGVYPREIPGGWRLLGRTEVPIWDPGREPPALLTPGRSVRFVAI